MTQKNIIITIITALIVGTAAFYGGMQYQKTQSRATFGQFAQGGFGGRFGARGGAGSTATLGKIVASDSSSITVQLQDGSSKIVNFSSSTRIVKTEAGASTDLTSGTEVAVFGVTNSDGSVTAQNIQINPLRGPRSQASPTPIQ